MPEPTDGTIRLCLAGDVMTGRGIDQILARPGDPTLYEPYVRSAETYVDLAEASSGPIPRRSGASYVWGEMLPTLEQEAPHAFIVNLETAVTDIGEPWPGKGIHYRMHPSNVSCLPAADIDVASLANNHVMDWSEAGLLLTLDTVRGAGIQVAGAGRDEAEAWTPATVPTPGGRVIVLAACSTSSGVPPEWMAGPGRPGVALLPDLSDATVDRIGSLLEPARRPGDVVVVSIHWGGNWGYEIPERHRRFARALVERAGVDVVHGHSSHHPLGIEVYRDRPILYGCGDLVTDYEGISGYETFRGELGVLYLPTLDPGDGRLAGLELVPTRMRRFRLVHPAEDDVRWLTAVLDRESHRLGSHVRMTRSDRLVVEW